MAENVVAWFDRITPRAVPDHQVRGPDPSRPRVRFADVLTRYARVFARNLPRYNLMFAPMRHGPGNKYEEYYAMFTLTIFIYEEIGGVCYDEDRVLEKALLLAFIDLIVDDPRMGIETAFRVGFHVFRGAPCEVPAEIREDTDHVRRVVSASSDKEGLFRYMIELGEVEKRLSACASGDYRDLRLVSNCKMLLGMFEWPDPEPVYALNCAGVVTDDVLDLATDETTYITAANLDACVDKAAASLEALNAHLPYDAEEYIPLYATGLRIIARAALESPGDASLAFSGARRVGACLAVLWIVRMKEATT